MAALVLVVPSRITLSNFRASFETAAMLASPSLDVALVVAIDNEVIKAYVMGQLEPRDNETFMGLMARWPNFGDEVECFYEEHIATRREAWRYTFASMDEVDYMTA